MERRFDRSRRDFGSRSFGPREEHDAVCAKCQQKCKVPFKPTEGRDVFCKNCWRDKQDRQAA